MSGIRNSFVVEAVRASLGEVYLVGGAVRDSLLGHDTATDLDFATPLAPEEVKKRLEDDGYKVVDSAIRFGTLMTTISRVRVEITTFRQETYEDGSRKPGVRFVGSIEDDLARRDFTMNAIAYDGEHYIDPFDGQADLIQGKIRAVGNPAERFREDPLRMLRALRFVATLGFTLESKTYDAIFANSELLGGLSPERVSAELDKLLTGPYWVRAIALGVEANMFEPIFSATGFDEYKTDFIELLHSHEDKQTAPSRLGRWGAVLTAIIESVGSERAGVVPRRTAILIAVVDTLKTRLRWTPTFANDVYERALGTIQQDSLRQLQSEYVTLQQTDDTRQYIVKEKMLRIEIASLFAERKFEQVETTAIELLAVETTNFELKLASGQPEEDVIRDFQPYFLLTARFICLGPILQKGRIETGEDLDQLYRRILKQKGLFDGIPFRLSDTDKALAIEQALLMLDAALPGRITTLSKAEILSANTSVPLTDDRLYAIKKDYIKQLIALRQPPYAPGVELERARLNRKIASLILQIGKVKDYSYYSHLTDVYKWRAIAATDKATFYAQFDKMNEAMDRYMAQLSNGDIPVPMNQYVDTAQCLVHLLSLEKDPEEKASIIVSIMSAYKLAGARFERNVPRYRLLLEWLRFGGKLIADTGRADVMKLAESHLAKLPELRSYHYQDIDEAYIAEHLPEIDTIRTYLADVELFLQVFTGKEPSTTPNASGIGAILELLESGFVDHSLAYALFQKVVAAQLDKDISVEPVSLADGLRQLDMQSLAAPNEHIELMQKGEGKTVEFKESWRYDVRQKQLDPTGEIRRSALKAIVSFMNTEGGTLFVGVNDAGEVTGLEEADFATDRRKNVGRLQLQDKLKRDIDITLKNAIGDVASSLVTVDFDTFDSHTFAVVTVRPSGDEVFLDDKFYIRHSASVSELAGAELIRFIRNRATPALTSQTSTE